GGHQNTDGGDSDAFLVKFNSAGVRQWATYYGGTQTDHGYSCATDGSGNVYLAGWTRSTTNLAAGGHQNTHANPGAGRTNFDAFLVKFNSAGIRQWATFYRGNNNDIGLTCNTEGSGNVYLAGWTRSTTNIASGGHQNTHANPGAGSTTFDAFLVKFNSAGIRQWATFYGGNNDDIGRSCTTDGSGNVYLAGET